ncbi:hypothetical protein [Streptomonospora litoralis]|nr:hypothetical protein [Streptomonospora litoralis]
MAMTREERSGSVRIRSVVRAGGGAVLGPRGLDMWRPGDGDGFGLRSGEGAVVMLRDAGS